MRSMGVPLPVVVCTTARADAVRDRTIGRPLSTIATHSGDLWSHPVTIRPTTVSEGILHLTTPRAHASVLAPVCVGALGANGSIGRLPSAGEHQRTGGVPHGLSRSPRIAVRGELMRGARGPLSAGQPVPADAPRDPLSMLGAARGLTPNVSSPTDLRWFTLRARSHLLGSLYVAGGR